MKSRNFLLSKIKEYIDTEMNPAKVNFCEQDKDDYMELKKILKILTELEISKENIKTFCLF